jgi:hypothetical protein
MKLRNGASEAEIDMKRHESLGKGLPFSQLGAVRGSVARR